VVVSSLVPCSVRDLPGALGEIRRVLKPHGRFVFLEHVGAPEGTVRRRIQRAVRGPWAFFGDGCIPDRDTGRAIEAAGFGSVRYDTFFAPLPLVHHHIAGVAER
jgi:SAM-dependent methyltransferase